MSELITTLGFVFITASILMLMLNRLTVVTVPAYVISGLVISSFVPESQMLTLSQLGIAFLVFVFGVKTDIERLSSLAKESVFATLIGSAAVSVPVFVIGTGFGLDALNSLYLAIAAGLSSSLVGLELIENEIRIDLLHGRLAESVQLMQDTIAVLVITLLGASLTLESISRHFFFLFLLLSTALMVRKVISSRLEKLTGGSRELTMLVALAYVAGFLGLGELLGTSAIVSSFAAGVALARFPENAEVLETVGPLKDFFSAVFFVALGALIKIPTYPTILLTLVLITATALTKPLINAFLLMTSGYDRRTSYLAGFSLDQVSEFALIIAIQAYAASNIAEPVFQSIIIAATLTMVTSSYTSKHGEKIYDLLSSAGIIEVNSSKIEEKTSIPKDIGDHVILLGYDTQGKEIAKQLKDVDEDFIVIENDPEKIMAAAEKIDHYIFGDAMDERTWKKAKTGKARLIVSTVPLTEISDYILRLETEADTILRSGDIKTARSLMERGATYVNVPEILSSEELVDHIKGVMENQNYHEELRRRNLLELRKELNLSGRDEEV